MNTRYALAVGVLLALILPGCSQKEDYSDTNTPDKAAAQAPASDGSTPKEQPVAIQASPAPPPPSQEQLDQYMASHKKN